MPKPNPATWVFLALAGSLFLISRTSGAGWILVILASLLGLVVANAGWAWWTTRSVRLFAGAPRDAVVGEPIDLTIESTGFGSIVRLSTEDPVSGLVALDVPVAGRITVTPTRRGVLDSIHATVTSDAPFGLARASRTVAIPLVSPIEVAPKPLPHPLPAATATSHDGDGAPQHRVGDGDVVRSLREYSVGDAPRLIHWAASARAGELRVKELEPPDHPQLEVVVDVSGPNGEVAAARAAGLIRTGLNNGLPVTLHTFDLHGPLSGPVGSALEAGRRLARAIPGVPPAPRSPEAVRLT